MAFKKENNSVKGAISNEQNDHASFAYGVDTDVDTEMIMDVDTDEKNHMQSIDILMEDYKTK